MTGEFWRKDLLVAVFISAIQTFASATDRPDKEQRGYCDDECSCMSTCGETGGTYYRIMPNGGPLCDGCAPV